MGGLAARQTLRRVTVRAGSIVVSDSQRQQMLDNANERFARDLVKVLGSMRGAAMKIGQTLSLMDLGIVEENSRDAFRQHLSELQGSIPAVPFETMRAVIEDELGAPVERLFASFDTEALAAASIGQVYRAVLHDGRDVAVKVQYPGIRAAVQADLKNLVLLLRMWKSVAPTVAANDMIQEITTELAHEVNYRREFANHQRVATRYADHPFIKIPTPIGELSSDSVLTSEYVSGKSGSDIADLPVAERDRIGEIIYRFYFGSLHRDCEFNGDAHPGNIVYLRDGRVAFLDFGFYKHMTAEAVENERQLGRLCIAGDGDALRAHLEQIGVLQPNSTVSAEDCWNYTLSYSGWHFVDDYVAVRPIDVSAALLDTINPASESFQKMRNERVPPEHLFSRRMDFMVFGTLGQFGMGGNWFRVASEWLLNSEPVTELGRAEARWRCGRP